LPYNAATLWDTGRRIALGAAAAGLISVLVFVAWPTGGARPDEIVISSGTGGGTYFELGKELADILRELRELEDAKAIESPGSFENVNRLLVNEAQLALVAGPVLRSMSTRQTKEIRVVAYMYDDVVQLLVHPDAGIDELSQLAGKKIHVGNELGATRFIIERILEGIELDLVQNPDAYDGYPLKIEPEPDSPDAGIVPDMWTYDEAVDRLLEGSIDAAFFVAGTPTKAVRRAIESGARLLSLEERRKDIADHISDWDPREVTLHARFYEGQEQPVMTLGTPVYLACRTDLDGELVVRILDVLFDNIGEMLLEHTSTGIRLQDAFPRLPPGLAYHRGAIRFETLESRKLRIATGAIHGMYNSVGREIADLLEGDGIETRVIHTDASVENARRLLEPQPTLAIVQHDVALAALFGNPWAVYRTDLPSFLDDSGEPLRVNSMRRIATLHDERLFVVATPDGLDGRRPTIEALSDLKVGLGPEQSGTRLLAEAILARHDVRDAIGPRYMPVDVMIRQLKAGQLDAGFFVSGTPSESLDAILGDPAFRLLSINRRKAARLTRRGGLSYASIAPGEFGCQREGEGEIATLATTAALVTTLETPDVDRITRAIFGGAGYLSLGGAEKTMQTPLSSFFGTCRGARILWRERMSHLIKERVLDVCVDPVEPDAVRRLRSIRDDVRRRARLRWLHPSQLDRARWHDLEEIIEHRVEEGRANRTKALLAGVRSAPPDDQPQIEHARSRDEAWRLAQAGGIGAAHLDLVLRALEEAGSVAMTHAVVHPVAYESKDDGSAAARS
jgi:TRAP transporter TAXI family solute receptor